jgi:hypothetical protein
MSEARKNLRASAFDRARRWHLVLNLCVASGDSQLRRHSFCAREKHGLVAGFAFARRPDVRLFLRPDGVSHQSYPMILAVKSQQANKALEPTPRLGVLRSLFWRTKPSGNLRGVAHL